MAKEIKSLMFRFPKKLKFRGSEDKALGVFSLSIIKTWSGIKIYIAK